MPHPQITDLPELITTIPLPLQQQARELWRVDRSVGHALIPAELEEWVIAQFGSIEAVQQQTVVRVVNDWTLEGALFAPLRARRPAAHGGDDQALEALIQRSLAQQDLFAQPLQHTTYDRFGRIRGQHCITASNIAKFDGWHGLVIFDEPHPLRFQQAQIADYLHTAAEWFAAAHQHDPQAIYPLIAWNCLPKSGATLMHGHMHISLARHFPATRQELWRRSATNYQHTQQRSYLESVIQVHQALGLGLATGPHVSGFAHLTPLRNREVVLIGPATSHSPRGITQTLATLASDLTRVLRSLIDQQGMRAFNVVIWLPPLAPSRESWEHLPAIVRLGDRGNPLAPGSDLGATEIYATGALTVDPFQVARLLQP